MDRIGTEKVSISPQARERWEEEEERAAEMDGVDGGKESNGMTLLGKREGRESMSMVLSADMYLRAERL